MTFSYETNEVLSLLWRATWQSSVLALLVAATIFASRNWLAAKWRVVLWMLPLCRMLLLVVPASGLSIFNGVSLLTEAQPVLPIEFSKVSELPTLAELNTAPLIAELDMQSKLETSRRHDAFELPIIAASVTPATTANERPTNRLSIATIAITVWLLGCVTMTLRWGWAALALRRTLARCEPLERDLWEQLKPASLSSSWLQALLPVRCLTTQQDLGPATCGFFQPTILLPQQLVSELTTDQLRAIIRHEYQHIRRFDVLLLTLSRCVRTIHWFNPVAYLVSRNLRRDMELAVDAATISSLQVPERQAYGYLLLQLARRPAGQFGLAQMADRRSDMKVRIEAISNPFHPSPVRSALAIGLIGTLLVVGCTQEKEASSTAKKSKASKTAQIAKAADESNAIQPRTNESAEQKYFVVGTVREAGTNNPVVGAEVQLLVESEQDLAKRGRSAISDADGKYRIEVPMGNVKLWFPWLKPGYWLTSEDAMKDIVRSPEQPEAVHDIVANKSPTWQVHAIGDLTQSPMISAMEVSDAAKRAALIKHENVTWNTSPLQAFSHLDANGRGELTQIGTSGGLFVAIVNVQAELVVEPGFDNTQVVSADRLPDSKATRMIDNAGKSATVTEAMVTLENGVPLLTFQLKSTTPIAIQKLTGRVIDENGEPILGARIGVAGGKENAGNSVWPNDRVTDQDGRFQLDVPIQEAMSNNLQFAAIVSKDGYAGIDTEYIDTAQDFKEIDFGTIKLAKGHSLPVQVVDLDGKPVAGASIEPGSSYSLRKQAVRSDVNGRATLNNLPSGVVLISARNGWQHAESKLVVSDDDRENTETILKLAQMQSPKTSGEQRNKTLGIGAMAPNWDLKGWSDGKERKITDYRGKVLVLDFWGVWCGPCVKAIPTMQALAEEYEPKDVVFLGIHTPDGELDQISKLKKLHGWTAPSGIDRGTSNADGTTSSAYGIRGYPSVLIIDRQGKIAFHSGIAPKDRDAHMEEMGELAKANGIAWPLNEKAPQSEQEENMSKLMQAMFSREIDRVLE